MIALSMKVPTSALRYASPLPAVRSEARRYTSCGKKAQDLVRRIAEERGYTLEDMTGPSQVHAIAHVRQECMWALRETGLYSLPAIGKLLRRDHSTVSTGIDRHIDRINGRKRPPRYTQQARPSTMGEAA